MSRVYLDSNIFIYAVGQPSPYTDPCRRILYDVVNGRLRGETSIYTVQEVARQRHRRGDKLATARARQVVAICTAVHGLDPPLLTRALDAVDEYETLAVADAIHAVTALAHGVGVVVSADSDFDGVAGVERVDPRDAERVEALASG